MVWVILGVLVFISLASGDDYGPEQCREDAEFDATEDMYR